VLLSEFGSDVLQALRPHYSALVAVADLAAGSPHIRAFLRLVASLQQRAAGAEAEAHHWRSRCGAAEVHLQQTRGEADTTKERAARARRDTDDLRGQLQAAARAHEGLQGEHRTNEERMALELERARGEVLRLGAQGMAQSQELAHEQAAMIACSHEINRLRVELEVVGTMSRQNAGALEAARRQAAGSDISAEQATQEKVRAEALLKHATREQHAGLLSATEAATTEAARLRRRIDGGKDELLGVRRVLAATEAILAEVQSISSCTNAAAEFLRDPSTPAAQLANGPMALAAGGPAPVRVPVLALRWAPGAAMDTTPVLRALRADGVYGIFHQLQTGAKLPEQIELTVCCADGRWFCARPEEAHRFAALLFFQALHRDAPVSATCRVGSVHSLMNAPPVDVTGLGIRSAGTLWRTPPLDDEDFLKALLSGTQVKEDLEQFFQGRRRGRVEDALREEAVWDPVGSVIPLPGPLRINGPLAAAQPAAGRGFPRQRGVI